ncbi:MAG: hypothetical protein U0575_12870 [Phycisphaerales bacterium]
MQLFVLIAVALVLVADGAAPVGGAIGAGFLGAALAAWIPPALIAIGCAVVVRRARSLLAAAGRRGRARRSCVARIVASGFSNGRALPAFAVAIFAFGWVAAVRGLVGNTILVDEPLVALLPPMVAATAAWWCWYPLERRLRELERKRSSFDLAAYAGAASGPPSAAPRRAGDAVAPRLCGRSRRVHLLLLLAPMLAALALAEATRSLLRWGWPAAPPWTADAGAAGAVARSSSPARGWCASSWTRIACRTARCAGNCSRSAAGTGCASRSCSSGERAAACSTARWSASCPGCATCFSPTR